MELTERGRHASKSIGPSSFFLRAPSSAGVVGGLGGDEGRKADLRGHFLIFLRG